MKASTVALVTLIATGSVAGAYWAGRAAPHGVLAVRAMAAAAEASAMPKQPLYYQDPDGKADFSPTPKKTADGKDYVPVYDDGGGATSAVPTTTASPPADKGKGRILYYRDAMGLGATSPVPKKDSMGMDYVPVYESDAAEAASGVVTIAPGRLQLLGVRTAPVERRATLTRKVEATGTLQLDERHLALATTRTGGWVEQLDVAATGEAVRRGQVLAEIYSPELVASEQEFLIARSLGGSLAAAARERLRALNVPDDEIARLDHSGRTSRRIAVRAPADGVVTEKLAVAGMRVGPEEPLYKTADLSTVWMIASVQEQDIGAVRPGAAAQMTLVAFPGRRFAGTVDFIYPTFSADTRTASVRILIPNADLALRPGMYATVAIKAPASQSSLAVPESAVLDSGSQQTVLVQQQEGRFAPRKVRIGARGDGYAEVLDGLAAGEQVVVGANFLIDSESNLRAALQAFTAPKANDAGQHPGEGAAP